MGNICVFASSSSQLDQKYYEVAGNTGILLADAGYNLVFGGGTIGLMGSCARGFHSRGKKVISVIPEFLKLPGVFYEESDEYYVTETLRKRKSTMEKLSDGFVILPGGFGTYEEMLEIITLKQLGQHNKPIAIVNCFGFYDPFINICQQLVQEKFTDQRFLELCFFANSGEDAVEYIVSYNKEQLTPKWMQRKQKLEKGDHE